MGSTHLAEGYNPADFPGGAYFAHQDSRVIAENFARHYKEGIIETRVPADVYEDTLAQFERPFLDIPGTTEVLVPPEHLPLLNQFPRELHPW